MQTEIDLMLETGQRSLIKARESVNAAVAIASWANDGDWNNVLSAADGYAQVATQYYDLCRYAQYGVEHYDLHLKTRFNVTNAAAGVQDAQRYCEELRNYVDEVKKKAAHQREIESLKSAILANEEAAYEEGLHDAGRH